MDSDLREAFATLSAQIASVSDDTRAATLQLRETASDVRQMSAALELTSAKVGRLEREVFGSKPPPPLPGPTTVIQRVKESEGDLAELSGQLMALQSELASVKTINEEQSKKLGLNSENAVLSAIRSASVKDVVRIATFIAAAMAAFYQAIH